MVLIVVGWLVLVLKVSGSGKDVLGLSFSSEILVYVLEYKDSDFEKVIVFLCDILYYFMFIVEVLCIKE